MDFNESPPLKTKQSDVKSPTKSATLKPKQPTLLELIKEGVYKMINKFEEILGADSEYATWEQFKKIMAEFTKDEEDIANFWAQFHFDNKFFYH